MSITAKQIGTVDLLPGAMEFSSPYINLSGETQTIELLDYYLILNGSSFALFNKSYEFLGNYSIPVTAVGACGNAYDNILVLFSFTSPNFSATTYLISDGGYTQKNTVVISSKVNGATCKNAVKINQFVICAYEEKPSTTYTLKSASLSVTSEGAIALVNAVDCNYGTAATTTTHAAASLCEISDGAVIAFLESGATDFYARKIALNITTGVISAGAVGTVGTVATANNMPRALTGVTAVKAIGDKVYFIGSYSSTYYILTFNYNSFGSAAFGITSDSFSANAIIQKNDRIFITTYNTAVTEGNNIKTGIYDITSGTPIKVANAFQAPIFGVIGTKAIVKATYNPNIAAVLADYVYVLGLISMPDTSYTVASGTANVAKQITSIMIYMPALPPTYVSETINYRITLKRNGIPIAYFTVNNLINPVQIPLNDGDNLTAQVTNGCIPVQITAFGFEEG